MNQWTPEIGEILKTRLDSEIVGPLKKRNAVPLAKTIFCFLRANHGNTCQVEIRRKRVNIGDGEGLQLPCTLQFSGEEKYIKY